jgi:hypothetical protein
MIFKKIEFQPGTGIPLIRQGEVGAAIIRKMQETRRWPQSVPALTGETASPEIQKIKRQFEMLVQDKDGNGAVAKANELKAKLPWLYPKSATIGEISQLEFEIDRFIRNAGPSEWQGH